MSVGLYTGLWKTNVPNAVFYSGSFTCAGTSDPSVIQGVGFTVARTGVGLYTITLDDYFEGIAAAVFKLGRAATDETNVHLVSKSKGSESANATFNIALVAGSTDLGALSPVNFAVAAAENTGDIVNFFIACSKGGVPY